MVPSTIYALDQCVFPKTPVLLPSTEYWNATRAMVRACVDVAITAPDTEAIYLPYRILPWAGWWTFGGRIFPGEPELISAQRILEADAGITLPEDRFTFIRWHRCQYFGLPNQGEPQDAISAIYTAACSEEERAQCVLDPKEYHSISGLRKVDKYSIASENIVQPIKDIFRLIYP